MALPLPPVRRVVTVRVVVVGRDDAMRAKGLRCLPYGPGGPAERFQLKPSM
jgi:hypothetical protein